MCVDLQLKPLIIPELLEPQKRRTRSNREMPAEEDLLEAAQAEVSFALSCFTCIS